MTETPLISIITVNLNNLEGLKKTMDSVFKQTAGNFEYLIIDGGSADGSKEYIELNNNKIDFWISKKDKGIFNAMNQGIKVAKGEYLLFLNSGDWLYNENVLSMVAEKLNGCDVLYGNMVKVFSDGKIILDKGVNGKDITLSVFIEETINHSSSFIHKRIFKIFGFYDESLKIVSDWKLFLIALGLNNSEVSYMDYPFSYFDMNGISNRNLKLRDSERKLVIQEEVPEPIYKDYLKLKEAKATLKASRVRKFLRTDEKGFSRKLYSIIFRIFS